MVRTSSPKAGASMEAIAQKLGSRPSAQQVLRWLTQGQGGVRQASLVSATAKPPTCSAAKLCSSELELSLEGSYAAIKSSLADTLERNPHITVKRLVLRAEAGSALVSATLEATVWGGVSGAAPTGSQAPSPR
jgi:hypothetical protein